MIARKVGSFIELDSVFIVAIVLFYLPNDKKIELLVCVFKWKLILAHTLEGSV